MEVRIPSATIESEERKLLREIGQQAKVPGFRPGKIPEPMLRKRFGSVLAEELKRTLVRQGFEKVTADSGLEIANIIEVDDEGQPEPASDWTVSLTVDVRPEFELPEYQGLELEGMDTAVSDEDVDAAIERLRRERADFVVVDRPAAKGDYVQCSYTGTIDGEEIAGQLEDRPMYGTQSKTWEEAGAALDDPSFGIAAIAEGLIGMRAGDRKEVSQAYPDDHGVEFLRGKTVAYELEVHEVRERKLPELDEAFLKTLQMESLEDLKAKVADNLEGQKKSELQDSLRRQAADKLASLVDFPLPESLVEQSTEQITRDYMISQMQRGASHEDLEKVGEQLRESAGQSARQRVKVDLILESIARKEELKVEQEELQRALINEAMRSRQDPQEIAKELRKDQGRLLQLQHSVLLGKALALVVDKASVAAPQASSASDD